MIQLKYQDNISVLHFCISFKKIQKTFLWQNTRSKIKYKTFSNTFNT